MRRKGEAGWAEVQPFLPSAGWPEIRGHLAAHIAPLLNPERPAEVSIQEVFWGDLGARPRPPASVSAAQGEGEGEAAPADPDPRTLPPAELAERLEARVCHALPLDAWPQGIAAAWVAAFDAGLRREMTAAPTPDAAWKILLQHAETLLKGQYGLSGLQFNWSLISNLRLDFQRQLLHTVTRLRSPLENFVPYFAGDVLDYLMERGTPKAPGPIQQRVLAALAGAAAVRERTGEPLIVMTHSIGAEIFYDAVTSFAPRAPGLEDLQVDFWASVAGQLGLFAELNLFLCPTCSKGTVPPAPGLGYLWNLWSPADLLSTRAAPALPQAHDTAMTVTEDIFKIHGEYLGSTVFYRSFAQKLGAYLSYEAPALGRSG